LKKVQFERGQGIPAAKGVNFRSFISALKKLHGDNAAEKTIDALPNELKENLREGMILPSNWYPLEWYVSMYPAAHKVLVLEPNFPRTIGYTEMRADLSGIYRVFLTVLSPEFLVTKVSTIFNLYFDTGHFELLEHQKKGAKGQYLGCTGFNWNLWQEIIGSMEGALSCVKATNVQTKVISGGMDNDSTMLFEMSWEPRK
jgi:hypothetical protein